MAKEHAEISLKGDSAGLLFFSFGYTLGKITVLSPRDRDDALACALCLQRDANCHSAVSSFNANRPPNEKAISKHITDRTEKRTKYVVALTEVLG